MSFSFSLHVPKALPPLPTSPRGTVSIFIASKHKPSHNKTSPSQSLHHVLCCSSSNQFSNSFNLLLPLKNLSDMKQWIQLQIVGCNNQKIGDHISLKNPSLALQIGALLALVRFLYIEIHLLLLFLLLYTKVDSGYLNRLSSQH